MNGRLKRININKDKVGLLSYNVNTYNYYDTFWSTVSPAKR